MKANYNEPNYGDLFNDDFDELTDEELNEIADELEEYFSNDDLCVLDDSELVESLFDDFTNNRDYFYDCSHKDETRKAFTEFAYKRSAIFENSRVGVKDLIERFEEFYNLTKGGIDVDDKNHVVHEVLTARSFEKFLTDCGEDFALVISQLDDKMFENLYSVVASESDKRQGFTNMDKDFAKRWEHLSVRDVRRWMMNKTPEDRFKEEEFYVGYDGPDACGYYKYPSDNKEHSIDEYSPMIHMHRKVDREHNEYKITINIISDLNTAKEDIKLYGLPEHLLVFKTMIDKNWLKPEAKYLLTTEDINEIECSPLLCKFRAELGEELFYSIYKDYANTVEYDKLKF